MREYLVSGAVGAMNALIWFGFHRYGEDGSSTMFLIIAFFMQSRILQAKIEECIHR